MLCCSTVQDWPRALFSLFTQKSGACLGAGSLGHCLEAYQAFNFTSQGPRVQGRGLSSVRVSPTDNGHAQTITPYLHRPRHKLNTSLYTLPYCNPCRPATTKIELCTTPLISSYKMYSSCLVYYKF